MNKRQRDSVYVIFATLVCGALIAWAGHTAGMSVVEDEKGERFVMMTMPEAVALNEGIKALREENAALKAKLAKGGCT